MFFFKKMNCDPVISSRTIDISPPDTYYAPARSCNFNIEVPRYRIHAKIPTTNPIYTTNPVPLNIPSFCNPVVNYGPCQPLYV